MKETGLEDQTTLQEKSAGEAGDDKQLCSTRQVEDEELPPEGSAIRTRGTELIRELGSDVDDGPCKQR